MIGRGRQWGLESNRCHYSQSPESRKVSVTSRMAASVMLVAVSAAACHHERGLKSPAAGEPIVVAEPTLQGGKAGTRAVFGDIEIVGNTTLSDQIIRRQLLYRPGDLFSRKDILDSQ